MKDKMEKSPAQPGGMGSNVCKGCTPPPGMHRPMDSGKYTPPHKHSTRTHKG